MQRLDIGGHRIQQPVYAAIAVLIPIALALIVFWGITHRPVRRLAGGEPPPMSMAQRPASQQGSAHPALPTPTLGPNDVLVYTLDGREVCTGYPVGDLGFSLRCSAPPGAYLFRVTNAAGESSLAVRYTSQVLINVSRP